MLQHDAIEPNPHIFRLNRDVRFSKDKSPYKTNFGVAFRRNDDHLRGGYYLHIVPGGSFLGGGFWQPNPEDLKHLRQQIALDSAPLRLAITSVAFRQYWGQLDGNPLKSYPKGFNKDHKDIDLLRMRRYVVTHQVSDQEVIDPSFAGHVDVGFKLLRPFFDAMSQYLVTNLNGEKIV
jgi:uncharacterized protein (TIGR02453 family)